MQTGCTLHRLNLHEMLRCLTWMVGASTLRDSSRCPCCMCSRAMVVMAARAAFCTLTTCTSMRLLLSHDSTPVSAGLLACITQILGQSDSLLSNKAGRDANKTHNCCQLGFRVQSGQMYTYSDTCQTLLCSLHTSMTLRCINRLEHKSNGCLREHTPGWRCAAHVQDRQHRWSCHQPHAAESPGWSSATPVPDSCHPTTHP